MSYEKTGEFKPDGRPILACAVCGARVAGHSVAHHDCQGKKPAALSVPCPKRGEVYTSIKYSSCCKAAVFRCGAVDEGFCTISVGGLELNSKPVMTCEKCPLRLGYIQ